MGSGPVRVGLGAPTSSRPPLLEERGPVEGWGLSTYTFCDHHCVYCITGRQGESTPRVARDQIVGQLRTLMRPRS